MIEFKDGEKDLYLDTAYRSGWDKVLAKSPVTGARIKKLMER